MDDTGMLTTSRREFLLIGAGATAWPLVAGAAHAAGVDAGVDATRLAAVVYDTRFPDSVAFARRCEALGAETHATDGDMTRLWYDDIHRLWQQGPAAIAGLTAHGPLFCFAELARVVRMRVVFRAEHRAVASGGTHMLTGPMPMVSDALRACRQDASLGPAMADIVVRCPRGRVEMASATVETTGVIPTRDDEPLYTWVIAPAVRA